MGLRGAFTRLLVASAMAASVLARGPLTASADDISDARHRLQVINQLKGSLQDNLTKAEAQEVALQQQIQETRDQINQTLDKIAAIEQQIAQLERQIAALEIHIAQTQLDLRRKRDQLANFLRTAYKGNTDPLAQLLGASNFQSFLNRAVAIEHMSFLGHAVMQEIKLAELDLQREDQLVTQAKRQADAQRADLIAQRAALVQQQAREQDLEAKLKDSITRVKHELTVINTQSTDLAQRIAAMEIARQDQLIAEAEQAAWQQAQFWMQNNLFTLPNANANHSTKYQLIWPLQQGTITQVFGPSTLPFEPPGFGYPHFHTGVDIAYNQGTPILAADDGVVVAASASMLNGQLVGYGNYVIVAHRNNFFTLYGHLLGFQVKAGDAVHQGQVLGYEGSTGNSTGPHVHFEYRYGGQPTNPLPYLPPNGPNTFSQ